MTDQSERKRPVWQNHIQIAGVPPFLKLMYLRSHDREDPFGRKFLNSLLNTQASFFFTGNMRPDLNDPCFPDH